MKQIIRYMLNLVLAWPMLSVHLPASAESTTKNVLRLQNAINTISAAALDPALSPVDYELVVRTGVDIMEQLAGSPTEVSKDVAIRFSIEVVAAMEKLYGPADVRMIPALRGAAQLRSALKDHYDALDLTKRAYEIAANAQGRDDIATRFLLRALGEAYRTIGLLSEAKVCFLKADYLDLIATGYGENSYTLGREKDGKSEFASQIVPVFFNTTRVRTVKNDPYQYFGMQRADTDSFGVTYVNVPLARQIGTIPHPSIFRLEFQANPDSHVVLKNVEQLDRSNFFSKLRGRIAGAAKKEALVYIHGFNQSFSDGVETAAVLGADLEIDGVTIAFSWPSKKNLLLYASDFDEATSPANYEALAALLKGLVEDSGAQHIYVIAHSMGNRLLLEAFRSLSPHQATEIFDHVVFASPDVESDAFKRATRKYEAISRRMTLYTSKKDRALELSEILRRAQTDTKLQRAGNKAGGVLPTKRLDVVDLSDIDVGYLGHSAFTYLVRDDLKGLIWLGLPAARRCILIGNQAVGWRYGPTAPCTSDAFIAASTYLRRTPNMDIALKKINVEKGQTFVYAKHILRTIVENK